MDVCIPSDMISRRHAIFKKGEDGVWTVTDNKVSTHISLLFLITILVSRATGVANKYG